MGVADNKTYKDQYHFNYFTGALHSRTLEDLPSMTPSQDEVKTKIKENPYRANVEIEKNEIVLAPDLSSLHHAIGKKHRDGGINTYLKEGTFVFSDDKTLGFSEEDGEKGELKIGKKTTPAEVLKKNIDIEHYNRLVTIINNPKADNLAKQSAEKMLQKYVAMLGNIAYLQEEKKSFPDGLPSFSQGSASLQNPYLEEEEDMQKQYAKYGGHILPKFQQAGIYNYNGKKWIVDPKDPTGTKMIPYEEGIVNKFGKGYNIDPRTGKLIPINPYINNNTNINTQSPSNNVGNPSNTNNSYSDYDNSTLDTDGIIAYEGDRYDKSNKSYYTTDQWRKFANEAGYSGEQNNKAFQTWLAGDSRFSKLINDLHEKFGKPRSGTWYDGKLGHRWDIVMKEWLKNKGKNTLVDSTEDLNKNKGVNSPEPPTPGTVSGKPQNSRALDPWRFNDWQKLSLANRAYDLASIRRINPYREQIDPITMDPYLLNPEQAVGDAKGMANQQLAALQSLSPIMRNAQANSTMGQMMQQIPGIRSQYDNQNAQIMNNARMQNISTLNQAQQYNRGADQRYYQQLATSIANQDNARSVARNAFMGDLLGMATQNQQLQYNLGMLPKGPYEYDWKSGNFKRVPYDIKNISGEGTDINTNLLRTIHEMKKMGYDDRLIGDYVKSFAMINKASSKNPYTNIPPVYTKKKGGKVNPYNKNK